MRRRLLLLLARKCFLFHPVLLLRYVRRRRCHVVVIIYYYYFALLVAAIFPTAEYSAYSTHHKRTSLSLVLRDFEEREDVSESSMVASSRSGARNLLIMHHPSLSRRTFNEQKYGLDAQQFQQSNVKSAFFLACFRLTAIRSNIVPCWS